MAGLHGEVAGKLTKSGKTWYGVGAVRVWVQSYLNYLAENEGGEFRAIVRYQINHRDSSGEFRLFSHGGDR